MKALTYKEAAKAVDSVSELDGRFDFRSVDRLHAVHDHALGQGTRRFAGNHIVNAAVDLNGSRKAPDGIGAFASCIGVASLTGVARDGKYLAAVAEFNGYAAAHGAGHANNILLHKSTLPTMP